MLKLVKDTSTDPEDIKAPLRKRFCVSNLTRTPDLRWTFAIRFFDKNDKKQEHQYSADTQADIESKRTTVVTRIRGNGLIPCDCQCAFVQDHIHECDDPTLIKNLKGEE